jgi:hypothetical protein
MSRKSHVIEIEGFDDNSMSYKDAMSLAKCLEYYAENYAGEEIEQMGYDDKQGQAFITLESGEGIVCDDGEEAWE